MLFGFDDFDGEFDGVSLMVVCFVLLLSVIFVVAYGLFCLACLVWFDLLFVLHVCLFVAIGGFCLHLLLCVVCLWLDGWLWFGLVFLGVLLLG